METKLCPLADPGLLVGVIQGNPKRVPQLTKMATRYQQLQHREGRTCVFVHCLCSIHGPGGGLREG